MLILSRKVDQTVVIPGRNLSIQVLRIVGNRVKLGISAPREVRVVRRECLLRQPLPLPAKSE
jgi:carbon storage regulator